jgi:bacillithiol system protein YtxJ
MEIQTNHEFDELYNSSEQTWVFKYSPICPISTSVQHEFTEWAQKNGVAVALVHVIRNRELARYIADITGIRHESPQLLVVGQGKVWWQGSHYAINSSSLLEALERI